MISTATMMQVLIIIADIVNASNTRGILFLHYKKAIVLPS